MGLQNVKAPILITRAQSAVRSGDTKGAEALYRQVLARFPANKRAREGLAKLTRAALPEQVDALLALWRNGDVQAALWASESLPKQHPTVRDVRAAALRALGRTAEAITLYDGALKESPDAPWLWFNAGSARLEAFRLSEADTYLRRACDLDPAPSHQLALALCKLEQGRHVEAEQIANTVLSLPYLSDAQTARCHDILGTAQLHLGQAEDALQSYDHARALAPQDPGILHNIGIASTALGERDAARQAHQAALHLAPDCAEVHRSLADLTRYSHGHPHIAQLYSLLPDAPAAAASSLHFALFKACDDLGETATAADHLIDANALRRNVLGYEPARDVALFEALRGLTLETAPPPPAGEPRPVFIVGLPRSGTTLTEQILSGVPDLSPGGELPYGGQAAIDFLRAVDRGVPPEDALYPMAQTLRAGLARHANDRPVVTDKMPLNFRWAELLLAALPDARIIWLDRAPAANAFSLYRHCFTGAGNKFAYGAEDITWMIAAERAHRARITARWPDRIHVVSLEDMTRTPEPVIRDMLAFCDLRWSEDCLAPQNIKRAVLTASHAQVRRAISPATSDPWDLYAPYLPDLSQAIAKIDAMP